MILYISEFYSNISTDLAEGVDNTLIQCRSVHDSLDWIYHIGYYNVSQLPMFQKHQTVTLAYSFRELSRLCLVDKQFNSLIKSSKKIQNLKQYYFTLLDNWYGVLPCGHVWTDLDEQHLKVMRMYLECSDSYLNWMWEEILTSDEYDTEDYQDLLSSINHTDYSLFLFEKRKSYITRRNTFINVEKLPISSEIQLSTEKKDTYITLM